MRTGARRLLLTGATRALTRLRPLSPPPVWELLLAARSVAGRGPVVAPPAAGRALVVAPHPDDETIGCGGTAALLAARGAAVDVVVATRGEASVAQPGAAGAGTAGQRAGEAARAARILGLGPPTCLELPDGNVAAHRDELAGWLAGRLDDGAIDAVFAPWPLDDHPDHRAVSRAVAAALERLGRPEGVQVWGYEVWAALPPNRLVDVTAVWGAKQAALDCHQHGRASFDLDAHLALSRWRSIGSMGGTGYAEAFLTLAAPRFCQLVSGLSGDELSGGPACG